MRAFRKKDLEEPIVESEYETLWGGWIRMANGWMLDLPEMASDTPLPITINARTRGKTGGLMKALPRIEFVNAADAKGILTDLAVRMRAQHCSVSRT
ncbi:putative nitrogen fixation protein FixT [Bradyrhizobium sp. GM24.11]